MRTIDVREEYLKSFKEWCQEQDKKRDERILKFIYEVMTEEKDDE